MKILKEENRKIFLGKTLVDYSHVFTVDKLPNVGEFVLTNKHKGYVIDIQFDEEEKYYSVYLEKNKGDWYDLMIDYCDVLYVRLLNQ